MLEIPTHVFNIKLAYPEKSKGSIFFKSLRKKIGSGTNFCEKEIISELVFKKW